jgi:hypothetical protein
MVDMEQTGKHDLDVRIGYIGRSRVHHLSIRRRNHHGSSISAQARLGWSYWTSWPCVRAFVTNGLAATSTSHLENASFTTVQDLRFAIVTSEQALHLLPLPALGKLMRR